MRKISCPDFGVVARMGNRTAMELFPNNTYHIYNRGNNGQKVFFSTDNYIFFREKIRKNLCLSVKILAYCLMPNHFHLMVYTPESFEKKVFDEKFRNLLSSYTKAINHRENRTGSLFQQNSKAKCISDIDKSSAFYSRICLNYIHQNPLRSGLVSIIEDWEYSSFREYMRTEISGICDLTLARKLIEIPDEPDQFYRMSNDIMKDEYREKIF
jgi:putative transposase